MLSPLLFTLLLTLWLNGYFNACSPSKDDNKSSAITKVERQAINEQINNSNNNDDKPVSRILMWLFAPVVAEVMKYGKTPSLIFFLHIL
jgi:hypothetical protein